LPSRPHKSGNGDEVGLGEVNSAVFVELVDGELDGCVVLGGDEAIGVVALSRQVDVGQLVLLVYGAPHLLVGVLDAAGLKGHLWVLIIQYKYSTIHMRINMGKEEIGKF